MLGNGLKGQAFLCLGLEERLRVRRKAADDGTLFTSLFSITIRGRVKSMPYIEGSESLLLRHLVFGKGEQCKIGQSLDQ